MKKQPYHRKRERRRIGPAIAPMNLASMPQPVAPISFGRSMYACNRHGVHVPLECLTVDEMRRARCFLEGE